MIMRKKMKPAWVFAVTLVVTIPALALLKTTVFSNNKNTISSDNTTKYDVVADLGEGGRFETGGFSKMPNGKWIYKYTPSKNPTPVPKPVKDGYTFEGWIVDGNQTPKPDYIIPAWNRKNIDLIAKWKADKAILLRGSIFDKLIKTIPGFENVTEIRFEKRVNLPSGVDLSDSGNNSISGYVQGTILYIVSTAEMYANKDCAYMFDSISNVTSIKFDNFNTSQVSNMSYMFERCTKLESINPSGWDTSHVTNMYSMFNRCSSLSALNIVNWDISKVTDTSYMFFNCSSLNTLNLVDWNTSQVTNMRAMFYGCSRLKTLDLQNWNTSQVTNMRAMFYGCSQLNELAIDKFNVANVINMREMFADCSNLMRLEFSTWDISSVTDTIMMFNNCSKLSGELIISNLNISDYLQMFTGCSADANAKFIVKYTSPETKSLARNMVNTKNPEDHVYLWEESSTLLPGSEFNTKVTSMQGFNNVTKLLFVKAPPKPDGIDLSEKQDGTIKGTISNNNLIIECAGQMYANSDCSRMFSSMGKLDRIDMTNFDTSKVKSMNYMFSNCVKLPSIDISNFDTSKVAEMIGMFLRCSELTFLDLSDLDISQVTATSSMFLGCIKLSGKMTISNLNISSYDSMFLGCSRIPRSRFVVNYNSLETKKLAESMVSTNNKEYNVVLGEMVPSHFNAVAKLHTQISIPSNPNILTLNNGTSAQYPKQVIEIQNNKIPNLTAPELNPKYAGQFGGYYYDEQCTKPVKQGDIVMKDLTIYARW